jgi:hypothetical protein
MRAVNSLDGRRRITTRVLRAQEVAAADATQAQYRHLRALRCAAASVDLPALTRLWRRPSASLPSPSPAEGRPAAPPMAARAECAGVVQAYARLTTLGGDRLARRAGRIKAALHRLSPASVWFTRH